MWDDQQGVIWVRVSGGMWQVVGCAEGGWGLVGIGMRRLGCIVVLLNGT
jgi:hypothetical protein